MALSKSDRIAFSLNIVSAAAQSTSLDSVKAQLNTQIAKLQSIDTANNNLFSPVNSLVNQYHLEFAKLDGNVRSTTTEQNILDSASKKIRNQYFPNDTTVTVPLLSSYHNVWSQIKPYANSYAVGKNYTETYDSTVTKESDDISAITALISSASSYVAMELTTGQQAIHTGTCSLPSYTTEATCIVATPTPGVWTPGPDSIISYTAVQTLKSNLVTAVNTLKSFLQAEVALIPTNDPDSTNQLLNQAAIDNINLTIIPALNVWLAYSDFNTSHGQTTYSGFYTYNSSLLAPTKLHSTQLSALQTALNTRTAYLSTRNGQLNTILGTITQNLTNGSITSGSGLYLKRYNFLLLRLDALAGSASQLVNLQNGTTAQDSIKASILSTKATYSSILPTSLLSAPSNGTAYLNLVDASSFSAGNSVYIVSDTQEEIQRAIKSISGNVVVLNEGIPAKYLPSDNARLYKDLT